MRFRKPAKRAKGPRFPGTRRAVDGHAAVYAVEAMASEAILVHSLPDFAEVTGPLMPGPAAAGRFATRRSR
jgi:hypothetical protein